MESLEMSQATVTAYIDNVDFAIQQHRSVEVWTKTCEELSSLAW